MAHSIADFIRPLERGLRGSAMWLPAGETVLPAGVAVNAYRNDTYFFFEVSKPVHEETLQVQLLCILSREHCFARNLMLHSMVTESSCFPNVGCLQQMSINNIDVYH